MYSHALVAYVTELKNFAQKAASTFQTISKALIIKPKYDFCVLKELSQNEGSTEEVPPIEAVDKDQSLFFAVTSYPRALIQELILKMHFLTERVPGQAGNPAGNQGVRRGQTKCTSQCLRRQWILAYWAFQAAGGQSSNRCAAGWRYTCPK